MDDTQLKVLSLNCWGLKFIAKDRDVRIRAIADELSASAKYDIIALQEIWVYSDYEIVRMKLSKTLPYSKFFYAGALGSGLAIFSKWPFIETRTLPYSLNGQPIDVSDWIVAKGCGSVLVNHPVLGHLEIFNTHANATGGDDGPEFGRAYRTVGAWDLAKHIRHSAALGRYIIVMGDFNSIPTSLAITLLQSHAGITDAWFVTHPSSFLPAGDSIHSAQQAIREYGMTVDSPLNTYTAGKSLSPIATRWKGKRLDYVWYRDPATRQHGTRHGVVPAAESLQPSLRCYDSQVVLTEKVPGHEFSFSDHFGLEATFSIDIPSSTSRPAQNSQSPSAAAVTSERDGTLTSLDPPPPHSPTLNGVPSSTPPIPANGTPNKSEHTMSPETLARVIQTLGEAYRLSRARSKKQLTAFVLALITAVALLVGSAWQPVPGVNPILILFAIVLGWFGTTALYSGFIWGRWEVNSFLTVIEELEVLRDVKEGGGAVSGSIGHARIP